MSEANPVQGGIALLCDSQGYVQDVLNAGLRWAEGIPSGTPFARLVSPDDHTQALAFLAELQAKGTAFGRPIRLAAAGVPITVTLAGTRVGSQWLILVADSSDALETLCQRLRQRGDVPLSQACETLVARERQWRLAGRPDMELYEEISRLNNELINLRRQLESRVARQTSEIRASARRFRAVFEQASLGIVLADLGGSVIDVNPSMRRLLRGPETAWQDRSFLQLLGLPNTPLTIEKLNSELLRGDREHFRAQQNCTNGKVAAEWLDISGTMVRDESGQRAFVLYVVDDVTGQKQAQAALLQAERLTIAGRLAASLVHEINNPLQSVIGFLGLAQEALGEGENIESYLETVMQEMRRVSQIVGRLRDLNLPSQLEEPQPTDVAAVVQRVMTLTKQQCLNHGVACTSQLEADLPPVAVVPARLQQVFLNIVLNAVDAMPEGGQLRISAASTDSPAGIALSFADSGVGIPAEALDQLFDPFYSTKAKGLGLGLFISRDIVEQYGGRITAENRLGGGSRFVVWLPA